LNYLELSSNFLTGTLPSELGFLSALMYLYLDNNRFEGTLSSAMLSPLVTLEYLAVNSNRLSGPLPYDWRSLSSLLYLDLYDNSFSGALPSSWGKLAIVRVDVSSNQLTGSLHMNVSAYPPSVAYFNVAFNSLSDIIPSSLASLTDLVNVNVSYNGLVGSIPSEFCSTAGVSIDVSGTGITCYSGCLTSEKVLVVGASPDCHDGSILQHFVILCAACGSIALLSTALLRVHGGSGVASSRELELQADGAGPTYAINSSGGVGNKSDPSVRQDPPRTLGVSYTVFTMAVAKLCLGVGISLTLNNWWSYSGGTAVPRNNNIIATCSNPTVGNCFAFCGSVDVITVDIVDDDLAFDDVYMNPTLVSVSHLQTTSYCVATLTGACGYVFWLDFKLLSILLHAMAVVLQMLLWRFGATKNMFPEPQKEQYDLILMHLFPRICSGRTENGVDGAASSKICVVPGLKPGSASWAMKVSLLRCLTAPLYPSVFWFLELVAAVYVWGELVYPPVYCNSVPPLSMYYYPILMSLLDLVKLNIYACSVLFKDARYGEAALAVLDLELLATYLWVMVSLGLILVGSLVRECLQCLMHGLGVSTGYKKRLQWAEPQHTAECEKSGCVGGFGGETVNPLADSGGCGADVELAYVNAVSK